MLPASLYTPKEALPLVDNPILNHLIWEAAVAGAHRVHLVLSETKMDSLRQIVTAKEFFERRSREDLHEDSLSFGGEGIEITMHVQENPGGVADAISVVSKEIDGAFLVILGDMVILDKHLPPTSPGFQNGSNASKRLVDTYELNKKPCVGVYEVANEDLHKYGVVEISDGEIREIFEKPKKEANHLSNHVLCGRYLLPEDTTKLLEVFSVEEYGEMQSIMMLNFLIENVGLNAVKLDDMQLYDSGDPVTWLKSQIDHALRREDFSDHLKEWILMRLTN